MVRVFFVHCLGVFLCVLYFFREHIEFRKCNTEDCSHAIAFDVGPLDFEAIHHNRLDSCISLMRRRVWLHNSSIYCRVSPNHDAANTMAPLLASIHRCERCDIQRSFTSISPKVFDIVMLFYGQKVRAIHQIGCGKRHKTIAEHISCVCWIKLCAGRWHSCRTSKGSRKENSSVQKLRLTILAARVCFVWRPIAVCMRRAQCKSIDSPRRAVP